MITINYETENENNFIKQMLISSNIINDEIKSYKANEVLNGYVGKMNGSWITVNRV